MRAVVMGGGSGSRLRPMVAAPINKHLATVGNQPMIYHVLRTLALGGVREVIISLNWQHPGLMLEAVSTFTDLSLDIAFTYNDGFGGGPGRDLRYIAPWVKDKDEFILMLGDSLFFTELDFSTPRAPHMWTTLMEVDDPSKYGQVKTCEDRVTEIKEKPTTLFSSIIQTGVWKLPVDFFERAQTISLQREGELHISEITKTYIDEQTMTCTLLPPNAYIDCGTPEALRYASTRVMQKT